MQVNTQSNSQGLEYVILQAISERQITKRVTLALFILEVLLKQKCPDIELKLKSYKKELTVYLTDLKYHKLLNYRDSIIDEHAIDYFGRDFGENDVLKYNIDAEKVISKLNILLIEVFSTAYLKATSSTSKQFNFDKEQNFENYE
ncbi:hypothetical protein GQ473_04930 [archaeon]|nr:hypothetical protein [archaeon]